MKFLVSICIFFGTTTMATESREPAGSLITKDSAKKMSLSDITEYAVSNNLFVRAKQKELDAARGEVTSSRSVYFPTLGVAGGYDQKTKPSGTDNANVGYVYSNWNLFNGFRDYHEVEAATLKAEKLETELEIEKFKVALEVEKTFHLFLYKQALAKVKERAISLNDGHLKFVQRSKSAGLSSTSDLMEFQIKASILESDKAMLEQEIEEARIRLKTLVGEEIAGGIQPVGDLQHQHLKGSLMTYIDQVKDKGTTIKLATKESQIAEEQAKKWKSGWLPRVDFEAQMGQLALDDMTEKGKTHSKYLILAKFDLFNGFGSQAEYRTSVANRSKADLDLQGAILNSVATMEVKYRKLKTIEQRVDIEDKNKERSEAFYKAVLAEYRRGIKNAMDLSVASENLATTLERRIQYKYDFIAERLELEQALGTRVAVDVIQEN